MDYIVQKRELQNLIASAVQIGFQRGLESAGKKPRFISQNKAYQQFLKSRVQTWVKDGRILPTTNGNGKTSTVYYEYTKLLEIDTSDQIIIHKPYISMS